MWVITAFFESSLAISIKWKISLICDPAISVLEICLLEIEAPVHKNLSMFTKAFLKGKNAKNRVNAQSLREKLNDYRLSSHWIIMQLVEVKDLEWCRQFYKIWFIVCTRVKHSSLPLSRKTSASEYICICMKVEKSIVLDSSCLGISKSEGDCGGKFPLIHSLSKQTHSSLFKRRRIPRIKSFPWYIPFMSSICAYI